MPLLVPDAAANPAVALVVELNHVYVKFPVPPLGVPPVNGLGVLPEQMVWSDDTVLPAIFAFTDTETADEVSLQLPEITMRLYHIS